MILPALRLARVLGPCLYGLSGILLAITPIVSHYIGAKQEDRVSFSVLAGHLSFHCFIHQYFNSRKFYLGSYFKYNGSSRQCSANCKRVSNRTLLWDYPIVYLLRSKEFFDALGETRTTMLVTLTSLPINVFFNYVLIFGKLGFP